MTSAPANLTALMAYWVKQGGVNLGIVGDAPHVAGGTSYHLGKDDLRPDAYSIQTARDKAGLSQYASAVDLGKLGGGYPKLRKFSAWLVNQCRHNAPDTRDVREVIYSPDGVTVLRWDRERGIASDPRDGEADNSHRTHTHISYYRDSRLRGQTGPFRRYFEPPPAHAVRIAADAVVRYYTFGPPGPGGGHCIADWVDKAWGKAAATYPCSEKAHRKTCDGTSGAYTVDVLSGPIAGRVIRVGAKGVTAT